MEPRCSLIDESNVHVGVGQRGLQGKRGELCNQVNPYDNMYNQLESLTFV